MSAFPNEQVGTFTLWGINITRNCKDPVKFLKFLDSLLDEKWSKIMNWGIEGEDYLVDEATIMEIMDAFKKAPDDRENLEKLNGLFWDLVVATAPVPQGADIDRDPSASDR